LALEYKSIPLEIKEINDQGVFVGLASPYNNIDDGNDRVLPSIGPINNGKQVPILYQHDITKVLGNQTLLDTQAGVQTTGQLILDKNSDGQYMVPLAATAYALLKKGLLKLSIGYKTLDFEYVTENGQTIRNLKSIEIMEVSLVTFPMNEAATVSSVKSQNNSGGDNLTIENKGASGSTTLPIADKAVKWDGSVASKNVFDKYTDDKGNISAEAKKAFFWVDTTKPNEKGSYKLGFADIVDDKLTAIPNGIKAAANAIRGARNPVDISDEDKKKVAKKINVYLKKLEFDEITDDQIKSDNSDNSNTDTTDKNKKSNPNKLDIKALDFNAVYQTRQNREARWDAESALDQSLDSIVQDEEMTVEDKLTASNKTIDDFCTMYKQVLAGLISAMSQKSLNYEFETKSAYMERKAGKKISKANKEQMTRCKDALSDAIAVLAALCDDEDSEDNTEEDGKACGGKKPIKSAQNHDNKFQNIEYVQKKSNNGTLELKSEEIKALEALCNTINENKDVI
jgi:hypothetical protein